MTDLQERFLRLGEEYNDLTEEYVDCGCPEERLRCASRMRQIIDALEEISGTMAWQTSRQAHHRHL